MDERVRAWVEDTAGGRISQVDRPPTGGSRELYCVDVRLADGEIARLVLRMEAGGAFAGTPISIRREATVYRALAGTAVPVPKLIGLSSDGEALLLERVPGESNFWALDAAERQRVFADFVTALAALHNLDVSALRLDGFDRPVSPEDHARLDLGLWAGLAHTHIEDLDPLVRYAGAWLLANAPRTVQRTVLVQGDTGPGNFLAEGGKVTGIVDWEFAHLGDPMDDIAWLEMRCGTGPEGPDGASGDLARQLAPYCEATGLEIDAARVDYYRVAVYYRCAVTAALAVSRGGGARGWFPYLLVLQRFYASLGDALVRVAGVSASRGAAESIAAPETPRTSWYDRAIQDMRAGVRGIADLELREQTRNLQIALHYLRAFDLMGPQIEELEAADRVASLGIEQGDDAGFEKLVEEGGAAGDEVVLRYLLRRSDRQRQLWKSLLERPRRR